MDKTKRETLMKMKKDIEDMIEASKRRQGSTTGGATVKNAPNGKEYMGPAYGERKGSDKPKPSKAKQRQRPGPGREGMMSKMEEERKRRKNGESAVVGS